MSEKECVPVVRCEKCVYYRDTCDWNGTPYKACHLRAEFLIARTAEYDFCSYGEMRDGK